MRFLVLLFTLLLALTVHAGQYTKPFGTLKNEQKFKDYTVRIYLDELDSTNNNPDVGCFEILRSGKQVHFQTGFKFEIGNSGNGDITNKLIEMGRSITSDKQPNLVIKGWSGGGQQSITQLHSVVIELSKSCFELKKLCAAVMGSSLTLLAAFTAQRIDFSFFMGGAVIIVFFWIADAQSYFYQEKIRIRMKSLQEAMLQRSSAKLIFDGVGMPVFSSRQSSPTTQRVLHSIFNWSMTFYYGLLAIDTALFLTYILGGLHSKP